MMKREEVKKTRRGRLMDFKLTKNIMTLKTKRLKLTFNCVVE